MIEPNLTWNLAVIALTLSSFTLLRIARKPTFHIGDKILSIWLLVLLAPLISGMLDLTLGDEAYSFFPWLNPSLSLLHGPLLFVYVQQLITSSSRFNLKTGLHLIPFVFFYLLFIFAEPATPIFPNPGGSPTDSGTLVDPSVTHHIFRYFGVCNLIIFVGYSVATIFLLRHHQRKISSYFSQRDISVSLGWVYAIPFLFGFLVVLNVLNEWVNLSRFDPAQAHLSSYVLFISVLCFFGVEQAPLFYNSHKPQKTDRLFASVDDEMLSEIGETGNKEEDSLAFDSSELKRIQTLMDTEKPFLNPDFTVYHLANSLGIPRRRLSLLLNSGLNKNFFQFVNEYRVNEVKKRLAEKQYARDTLLDVALDSGFKSKSTFNSIFKQYTGVTPSQFRKQGG